MKDIFILSPSLLLLLQWSPMWSVLWGENIFLDNSAHCSPIYHTVLLHSTWEIITTISVTSSVNLSIIIQLQEYITVTCCHNLYVWCKMHKLYHKMNISQWNIWMKLYNQVEAVIWGQLLANFTLKRRNLHLHIEFISFPSSFVTSLKSEDSHEEHRAV